MKATMTLGDFLVTYLQRAGVQHLFGLPGDLVLGLFQRFGRARGLEIVTLSHEPSVGFAADGYARSTRRLGVVCVTYGAGGHNVVNAVAGAYAERVPLLVVSGGPGEAEQKVSHVHHQVKDVDAQRRVFSEVTCGAEWVAHPERAARQIHELVTRIRTELRPGYLEIHRDAVDLRIPVPAEIRAWKGGIPRRRSHRRKLAEAVADTAARVDAARRPVLVGGVELFRERAERAFRRLAERLEAPVLSTVLAKGVFPMDHPLHLGVAVGPKSHPEIARRLRASDLVLSLGAQRTDLNLGASRPLVAAERSVWAEAGRVAISHHHYDQVELSEFVSRLASTVKRRRGPAVHYRDNLRRPRPVEAPLAVNDLLVEVNRFLVEHPDHHLVAESGDMLFGGLEVRLRGRGLYLAQGYYASMGFAIPAALGAQIGTGLRPLVLCGDGGFQMTGPEVSHAPRLGLSPIVILVNNGEWGIFGPVTARRELLALPSWPYAEMAQGWGGLGAVATTRGELRDALRAAHEVHRFALIECRVDPDDLSPLGRRYIQQSARKARG